MGLLMLIVIVLPNGTPVALGPGAIEVTSGPVVSAVDEELVVNVVAVKGASALPSVSRRPLMLMV